MPIISASPIDKKIYRITITLGHGMIENVVISEDGLYDMYYIKDGKSVNHSGRILNVVQNKNMPQNSYVLFDWSEDNSNRRERIHFHQIQVIKDITPNDAYRIAVDHGFVGTVGDWLESLKGDPGKDSYEIAVECGFEGTRDEWLESIRGSRGYSAFEIAVQAGFEGTEKEWLASLQGKDGKSAYEVAVINGFEGTETEWLLSLTGPQGDSAYDIACELGFTGTQEEWLESLRGQSAYEAAVARGFEGTEEDWFAANGDTIAVKQNVETLRTQVEEVIQRMQWVEGM